MGGFFLVLGSATLSGCGTPTADTSCEGLIEEVSVFVNLLRTILKTFLLSVNGTTLLYGQSLKNRSAQILPKAEAFLQLYPV